jgi:hypothetical protein
MTTFSRSPRLAKGGIVLLNADTGMVQRIISLQYNPTSLSRTLQVQGADERGDRSEALRLKGPPQETYKLEAEIDAADQLEFPDKHDAVVKNGILPQLALLESLIYPSSNALTAANTLAAAGTLEIEPAEAAFTLFVWGKNRVLPVRITEFSVTEETFDPALNPLQAKVSLGMRVLNVNDLGFEHRGGSIFMAYHRNLERLAGLTANASFAALGITGVP